MTRRVVTVGMIAILMGSAGFASGASAAAGAPAPPRGAVKVDVLGIRIGMTEAEAQRRLGPFGTRRELESEAAEAEGAEPMERELWTLRATDFGFVALGIGEDGRVGAIQAHVRPGRHAMRYREIGSLAEANKVGYNIFRWRVPGGGGAPGLWVEARGTDPEYLGSYSIVRDRTSADQAGRREAAARPPVTE